MSMSTAERMRLKRARARAGIRCVRLEIHDREIAALIRLGCLAPAYCRDADEVKRALYRFFKKTGLRS